MDLNIQQTFAIIKPDAVASGYAPHILKTITEHFTIVESKCITLTSEACEYFYEEHKDKSFYPHLRSFMMSGPCVCLVLEAPNAIKKWREIIGPTNVKVAKLTTPNSMRALYGDESDTSKNACHGSDSVTSAEREIDFLLNGIGSQLTKVELVKMPSVL